MLARSNEFETRLIIHSGALTEQSPDARQRTREIFTPPLPLPSFHRPYPILFRMFRAGRYHSPYFRLPPTTCHEFPRERATPPSILLSTSRPFHVIRPSAARPRGRRERRVPIDSAPSLSATTTADYREIFASALPPPTSNSSNSTGSRVFESSAKYLTFRATDAFLASVPPRYSDPFACFPCNLDPVTRERENGNRRVSRHDEIATE